MLDCSLDSLLGAQAQLIANGPPSCSIENQTPAGNSHVCKIKQNNGQGDCDVRNTLQVDVCVGNCFQLAGHQHLVKVGIAIHMAWGNPGACLDMSWVCDPPAKRPTIAPGVHCRQQPRMPGRLRLRQWQVQVCQVVRVKRRLPSRCVASDGDGHPVCCPQPAQDAGSLLCSVTCQRCRWSCEVCGSSPMSSLQRCSCRV